MSPAAHIAEDKSVCHRTDEGWLAGAAILFVMPMCHGCLESCRELPGSSVALAKQLPRGRLDSEVLCVLPVVSLDMVIQLAAGQKARAAHSTV